MFRRNSSHGLVPLNRLLSNKSLTAEDTERHFARCIITMRLMANSAEVHAVEGVRCVSRNLIVCIYSGEVEQKEYPLRLAVKGRRRHSGKQV